MMLIAIVIPLLIAWWVASDAKKRGYNQGAIVAWFLGVWLVLIVFLPLYFILRPKSTTLRPKSTTLRPKPSRQVNSTMGTYVCPYCGNLYQEKVPFCPYCGRKLEDNGS